MNPSTDLEQRSPARDLVAQIQGDDVLKQQIVAALPANVTFGGFTSALMTALVDDAVRQPDDSKRLVNADRTSLFQAVVKCAADGLLPDGREAALVKRGAKVAYQPMVGGFRKIAGEHGWTIRSHAVFANDEFAFTTEPPTINHKPARPGEDRGELVAAYAVARHRDGRREQVVIERAEILKRRALATTQQVWEKWEPQQWEKTAARDLFAELPMDPLDRDRITRVIDASELEPGESTALLYGLEKSSSANGEAAAPPAHDPSAGAADGIHQAGDVRSSPETSPAPGADDDFGGEAIAPDVAAAQAASTFEVAVPQTDPARGGWVNGLTLAQINARGDDGEKFFRWALGRQNQNEELKAQASAYAKVQLPALWAELAEMQP